MPGKMKKAFEKMTPEQKKKARQQISDMMGMPPKKKQTKKGK